MSLIIDLNLVCVVCLQDGELRSVFERDDSTELTISEKITKCCADLSISADSKLPDKICKKCLWDLTAAYRFRQNCEAANAVFRTIEQQEDVLANYELEQHKIKIPSGLKIKRIQPETKTYILPIQMEQVTVPAAIEPELETITEQMEQEPVKTLTAPELETIVEQNGNREQETAVQKHVDADVNAEAIAMEEDDVLEVDEDTEEQLEEVELDDYYEVEEVLEEHFVGEIVEIKVEKQEAKTQTKPINSETTEKPATKESKPEIKAEADEEFLTVENTPPTLQQHTSKRGRGRPKKSLDSPLSTDIQVINTLESKDTNLVKSPNSRLKLENLDKSSSLDSENLSHSAVQSTILKPIAVAVVPMRKRKFLSSDSRPTKICDICGNSYKYQHALNAHMRRHNNDRPFSCEFCEKAFVSAVELRRHMRVHTGHKPYACQYCERRFSDFGSRIKHERTHTGERPYRCSTCGKSFAYAHVLSVHVRTHTGEKKFKCNFCCKGFTKKVYLATHMEQHARLIGGDVEARNQQDLMAFKNVALEECIFTTEYINTADEDNMSEEHLEDDEDDDDIHETGKHFQSTKDIKVKQEEKTEESDDSNCETMA